MSTLTFYNFIHSTVLQSTEMCQICQVWGYLRSLLKVLLTLLSSSSNIQMGVKQPLVSFFVCVSKESQLCLPIKT